VKNHWSWVTSKTFLHSWNITRFPKMISIAAFFILFLALFYFLPKSGVINAKAHNEAVSNHGVAEPIDKEKPVDPNEILKKADPIDKATKEKALESMKHMVQPFIENKGQVDEQVAFYIRAQGGSIFLTQKGEVVVSSIRHVGKPEKDKTEWKYVLPHERFERYGQRKRVVFKLVPETNSDSINVYGQDKAKAVVNYFVGEKEDWKGAIAMYKEVVYEGLFPHTRVIYRAGLSLSKAAK
jgi:hypothetical protein